MAVIDSLIQVIVSMAAGIVLGLAGYFFRYIQADKLRMYLKFISSILVFISFPVAAHYLDAPNAKYIGVFFYGYVSYVVWGNDKPSALLTRMWFFMQPLLFASVGATVVFSELQLIYLLYSLIVILVGLILRVIIAFFISKSPAYNMKERVFMAVTWIPKGTV